MYIHIHIYIYIYIYIYTRRPRTSPFLVAADGSWRDEWGGRRLRTHREPSKSGARGMESALLRSWPRKKCQAHAKLAGFPSLSYRCLRYKPCFTLPPCLLRRRRAFLLQTSVADPQFGTAGDHGAGVHRQEEVVGGQVVAHDGVERALHAADAGHLASFLSLGRILGEGRDLRALRVAWK